MAVGDVFAYDLLSIGSESTVNALKESEIVALKEVLVKRSGHRSFSTFDAFRVDRFRVTVDVIEKGLQRVDTGIAD